MMLGTRSVRFLASIQCGLAFLLLGCGSTVANGHPQSLSGLQAADADGSLGSGTPLTRGIEAGDFGQAAAAEGLAAPGAGQAAPAQSSFDVGPPRRTGARDTPRRTIQTSAPEALLIGIAYSSDYEQSMEALGLSGLATGDVPKLARSIIADINRRGGIFGRRLELVFHNVRTADALSDMPGVAQAICSDFLEDHHAQFVLTGTATMNDCFVKARVPVVQYGTIWPDDGDRAFMAPRTPYLYETSTFETDGLYPVWIRRLEALGYFRGWDTAQGSAISGRPRIGLLHSTNPSQQRQARQIRALLAKRGLAVVSNFEYDATNHGTIGSQMSSAVLRFRTNQVTHVIGLAGQVALFMIQAEQQGYRPRYAMNTFMGPSSVQQPLVPPAQLRGALGVGWEPINDVADYEAFRSAGRAACDADIKKSGQDLRSSPTALFTAYSLCDSLNILVVGATSARSFEASAGRQALGKLGHRFPTALNLRGAYSPTMSAGASAARDLAYDEKCSCFRYLSTALHD